MGGRSFTSQKWVATTRRIVKPCLLAALLVATPALAQQAAPGMEPSRILAGISGLDFSKLPTSSQKELATVFTDEFDWCGRPMTVAASLKSGTACKHTRRMAVLAAAQAMDGSPATEIIVALSRYNQSFTARRTAFKPDERMCQGPKDAKVTLVEFSDFECPYCAAARPMLEQAIKARKDARLCFQPFPLQNHPHSVPAAQAVLFARDSGKFWQMHDALFDNQLSISDAMIKETAKKLGLDDKALTKAIASGKYLDELTASKELGKTAGVDATPSVYLNGRKLTLNISPEAIVAAIDDELEWVDGKNAWPSN
jgi:protein-disulfide isomerase